MEFIATDQTGSRAVGPLVPLKEVGPKHHGIVIGLNIQDGQLYVAEQRVSGYQLVTMEEFECRYAANGKVRILSNDGRASNLEVARRALAEVRRGGGRPYHLISNNCESFCNRAMYGISISGQVILALILVIVVVFMSWQTIRAQRA